MKKEILDFNLVENKKLSSSLFVITLKSRKFLPQMQAGQFAEIEIPNNKNVFLRRPFSITDVDYQKKEVLFLIKKVGKGTQTLLELEKGSKLNVILPLGRGYEVIENQKLLLIGGGSGMASIFFLAKQINSKHNTVLLGGRSQEDIVFVKELKKIANLSISTEDGSIGEKGLITQNNLMQSENLAKFDKIYACGPEPMLKAVAEKAKNTGINCEVSLENTMACGIGACLCCVTPTTEGHQCVCTEGPIFDINSLKW